MTFRLTFQKPVVLSFEHRVEVASLPSWEIDVYHCDSLFSAGEDTSWVKLVKISISMKSLNSRSVNWVKWYLKASVGEGQQPLESMATMSSKSSSPSSSEASSKSSKKSHCSSKVLVWTLSFAIFTQLDLKTNCFKIFYLGSYRTWKVLYYDWVSFTILFGWSASDSSSQCQTTCDNFSLFTKTIMNFRITQHPNNSFWVW